MSDWQSLWVSYTDMPVGLASKATLSFTPSGPGTIGARIASVNGGDSTGDFTITGYTPGVQYTFTIVVTNTQGAVLASDSYAHRF